MTLHIAPTLAKSDSLPASFPLKDPHPLSKRPRPVSQDDSLMSFEAFLGFAGPASHYAQQIKALALLGGICINERGISSLSQEKLGQLHYDDTKFLGAGQNAKVYSHTIEGKSCALKVTELLPDRKEDILFGVLREASNHFYAQANGIKNLIHLREVVILEDRCFLVLEHASMTLKKAILDNKLRLKDALSCIIDAASQSNEAKKIGLGLSDYKLDNYVFCEENGAQIWKRIDLGASTRDQKAISRLENRAAQVLFQCVLSEFKNGALSKNGEEAKAYREMLNRLGICSSKTGDDFDSWYSQMAPLAQEGGLIKGYGHMTRDAQPSYI